MYTPNIKIHKNIMLPPFYIHVKLRVFEKTVLTRRGWRKLHNEELHNLYSLSGIAVGLDGQVMKYI
jgi:hypothetical protein